MTILSFLSFSSLVNEYLFGMNLEILILHFENKNYFDVKFETICSWILATRFFFLEKRLFALVFGDIVFGESMSWGDLLFLMGFQSEGLEKQLEVLFEKNCLFLNTYFINMNNNE